MGCELMHIMTDDPKTLSRSNSSSNINRLNKMPSPVLVKPILMLRTVAIRITLRYGTLAFKQIKVNKTKTLKVPPAPDDFHVMLCCESTDV